MKRILTSTCVAVAGLPAIVTATTVSHTADNTAVVSINDLTGFETNGADMAGMRVTALFAGGGSQALTWSATSATAGGVTGGAWSLDADGDTFFSTWRLLATANAPIVSLLLQGLPPQSGSVVTEGTAFDRTNPFFGTDGSFRGIDLDPQTTIEGLNLRVTYSNPLLNLASGQPLQEDLYGTMRVDFFPGPATVGFTGELLFLQDTDTIGPRSPDIPQRPETEPEPGALGLLLGAGLMLCRRRRDVRGNGVG